MARQAFKEEPKRGVPSYMVSFGDMMTLILTFFILLVSMAEEQNEGLIAKGLGSYAVAVRSHGMSRVMSEQEEARIFEHFRKRFNLPPEPDEQKRAEDYDEASRKELVRATVAEGLAPHHELFQPQVASFAVGSFALDRSSRSYLDRLAASLRPVKGQALILEGHAQDGGEPQASRQLAFQRAEAVRRYLTDEHGYRPEWIEPRAWLEEIDETGLAGGSVDARLITPDH